MSDSIKAELVYFRIDASRPEGRKAYEELCESLQEIPFKTWVTDRAIAPVGCFVWFTFRRLICQFMPESGVEILQTKSSN